MTFRFVTDNEPVDRRRLPPTGGAVIAKRLERFSVTPDFPTRAAALTGIPAAAVAVGSEALGLGAADPLAQAILVGGSALPFAAVVGRYLWGCLNGREYRWPSLASEFPSWRALVDRLKDSPHAVGFRGEIVREKDHLFLGQLDRGRYPMLLHKVYLGRPAIIVGRTGSGKTKLVAESLLTQAIARGDLHVLVTDLKGDKAFMLALAQEATRRRVDFKWLTIEPGKSSYLWNPFDDGLRFLTREQFVQIVLRALALVTGQEHGAGYFGAMQEERSRRTFEQQALRSFREFYRAVRDQRAKDIGMDDRDFSNAGHLIANLARIASVGVLNAVPGDNLPERALRHAISLQGVLSRPGVTYLTLPAQLEPTTAMFVAKLVIHLLAAVARVYQGPRVPVLVWADEIQEALGPDLATPIRQARESDVTYWFGFQDLAALQTGQGDFGSAVLGNTPLKIFCTAEDEIGREYLRQTSGELLRPFESVSRTRTVGDNGGTVATGRQLREELVPRIDDETINRVNRDPNAFIVCASESKGFSQYRYPVVVRSTFPASPREAARRQSAPWPRGNRFTVTIEANRAETPPPPEAPRAATRADGPTRPIAPQAVDASPPQPAPAEAVDAATPPAPAARRRGRPPKRSQAEVTPSLPAIAERTGTGEMAEYLRRLAEETAGAEEQAK